MSERLHVDSAATLLPFLTERLAGWRRHTIKQRLRLGCVRVGGRRVTRHDHPLAAGDEVRVEGLEEGWERPGSRRELTILHQDEDLVAIDKPAGLLSVATDRERDRTALALLERSLALRGPRVPPARETSARPGRDGRERLFAAHRIDRETSGVLLFARSRDVLEQVQHAWDDVRKVYLAIVEGRPDPPSGEVSMPLWEDKSLNVRVGDREHARSARTVYKTLQTCEERDRALLEVELLTGRRHQIRAHLAFIGTPVVGDARYGNAGARLGLHALMLELEHPRSGERLRLRSAPPKAFTRLLRAPR